MGRPLCQYDVITATFRPRYTDDLRFGAELSIGLTGEWQAVWIIEPGDDEQHNGRYAGQWAMQYCGPDDWPFDWAPLCDLEEVAQRPNTESR